MIVASLLAAAAFAEPIDHPPTDVVSLAGATMGGGWLDGDHDGIKDLAVAMVGSSVLEVFTRGADEPPSEVPLPADPGTVLEVVIGEEADGTTFALVSYDDGDGSVHFVHATWTANGFEVDWTEPDLAHPFPVGDVDGDGATDVWIWPLGVRLSGSGAWSGLPEEVHGRALVNPAPVGDVDGDGHADLLATYGEYAYGGSSYAPIVGHAALYRGSQTGLETTPLWELDSAEVDIPHVSIGLSAVGLGDGQIVVMLTDLDGKGGPGDDWFAIVHEADTPDPVVGDVVNLEFDGDYAPAHLALDTAPNGDPAIVAYGERGADWFKWNPSSGHVHQTADASWTPAGSLNSQLASAPLAMIVGSVVGSAYQADIAVWETLHVGPVSESPPETPTPPGDAPEVDQQLIVVTENGTTCWCGVSPSSGSGWLGLTGLAVLRARTRSRQVR